jgi:hypothetical protein
VAKDDALPTKVDGISARWLRIFTTVSWTHFVSALYLKSLMSIFVIKAERATFVLQGKPLSADIFCFNLLSASAEK